MEYSNNDLNNNFNNMNNNVPNGAAPKKSGKAGYVVTIIFLLLVIVALVVLFVFKEKIFPAAQNTPAANNNQNTLVSNTIEDPTNTINPTAQNQLINSVKGYWIASTGDLFLAITDIKSSSGTDTVNFSLTGANGITSGSCTIDSNKITCNNKVYDYKMQGNYLILSYDNVTRNFAPSNYYQLSKQSKKYYANMMGYTLTDDSSEEQITGEYVNKTILGTWKGDNTGIDETLSFELQNGSIIASKVNNTLNQATLNIPVGMNEKSIEFVDSSSTSDEKYSYIIKDGTHLTLYAGGQYGTVIQEYTKVENSTVLTNEK